LKVSVFTEYCRFVLEIPYGERLRTLYKVSDRSLLLVW
jgi:hypothetical protein